MTYEQKVNLYNKAVDDVLANWDIENDCPKTSTPMFNLTDTPYGKYTYEKKATRIANIQVKMEPYLKSTIHDIVLKEFFHCAHSRYYLDSSTINKFWYGEHYCNHQLLQPIHDVMSEVFRYQNRGGVQRPLIEIDYHDFFSCIYSDIDFLETVNESYHIVCLEWYNFVCKEMMANDIIRHLGYSLLHYDDDNDHYHVRSRNESYLAARYYQDCHPEIQWKIHYAQE